MLHQITGNSFRQVLRVFISCEHRQRKDILGEMLWQMGC